MHKNNVYTAARWYITMGRLVGIRVDLRISDKLEPDETYLYISNHQSTYDLVTVAASARPGTVTVGKKSLKWIPVFGLIYWLSGNIMIDRKHSQRARDTLTYTAKLAEERQLSIYMFPEGTRSNGQGILPFKTGAFRLAQMMNKAIVPVCCSDISDIRLNKWDNGTVIVEIMAPVKISQDESVKSIAKQFEEMYKEKLVSLTDEAQKLSSNSQGK